MKKYTLMISGFYLIYFVGIFVSDSVCHESWCRVHDDDFFGQIFFLFMPLLPAFLFSLITYKMREEVFQAWWSFARWFVPMIIVITFLLYRNGESGGAGMTGIGSGVGEAFILLVLYAIFIITSFVKIILAYRRSK
jgi:hypothetical protein